MNIKKMIIASMVLACANVFAVSAPPKIDIHQALSAAENAGYKNIQEIELENGVWEVKGLDDQGNKFKVTVDATTGTLTKDND